MINIGGGPSVILGIFLAVSGIGLYFLRSVRPELSRDHDIFFAAVGLLCGCILIFNGWRQDPILQFGQFLLTGSTIFFAVESIRLRKIATEQAKRNTPTVDRDRPVSRTRVYREEEYDREQDRSIPESYNAYEGAKPNYDSPRLRGYDDPQPRSPRSRSLREESDRSRSPRRREERYNNPSEPPRTRRPKNNAPRRDSYDEWAQQDSWDEPDYRDSNPPVNRRERNVPRPERDRNYPRPQRDSYPEEQPRSNSRRPPSNPVERPRSYSNDDLGRNYDDGLGRSYEEDLGDDYNKETPEVIATDYVDYQPMDDLGSSYDGDDSYDDEESDYNDQSDRDESQPRQPLSDWDEPRKRDERSDYEY